MVAILTESVSSPQVFKPDKEKSVALVDSSQETPVELTQLAKLSWISTVATNKEIYNEINSEDSQFEQLLSDFLSTKDEHYKLWRLYFMTQLYNVNPSDSIEFIQTYLSDKIQPYRQSLASRLKDGLADLRLECRLANLFLTKDMFAQGTTDDESVMAMLKAISSYIAAEKTGDIKPCLTELLVLYDKYGRCHSKIHFIEFVVIVIIRLATVKHPDLNNLPATLQNKLALFKKGIHTEIFYLPFVEIEPPKQKLKMSDIIKKMKELSESTEGNDVVNAVLKHSNKSSFLSEGITVTRDLIFAVYSSLSMTEEDCKSYLLQKYLTADSIQYLSILAKAAQAFKTHLVDFIATSGSLIEISFDNLTVFDAASPEGLVQKYMTILLDEYQREVDIYSSLFNLKSLPSKKLSAVQPEDLIRIEVDEVYTRLCQLDRLATADDSEFKRALRCEVYQRICSKVTIENDLATKVFRFAGKQKFAILKKLKEMIASSGLSQKSISQRLAAKVVKIREFRELLEIENSLERYLEEQTVFVFDNFEPIEITAKIKVDYSCMSSFYRILLLKKLDLLHTQNRRLSPSRINNILQRALTSDDNNVKSLIESILVNVVARETDTSAFSENRIDILHIETNATLCSVSSLTSIIAGLSPHFSGIDAATIGDLLYVASKLCSDVSPN